MLPLVMNLLVSSPSAMKPFLAPLGVANEDGPCLAVDQELLNESLCPIQKQLLQKTMFMPLVGVIVNREEVSVPLASIRITVMPA